MKKIKILIKYIIYLKNYYLIKIKNNFLKLKLIDEKNIPIIINNRNRLTYMVMLISTLETRGYKNIHIIDNRSTYQPLLDYYKNCSYKIYFLEKNLGHLALWKSNIHKNFINNFYVYTDSDVVLSEECPRNFLDILRNKMISDNSIMKIGLSLRLHDLPSHYKNADSVKKWESQFYLDYVNDSNYYLAKVDTTFALYRPFVKGGASYLKMLRSKFPIDALHMPWYVDSNNLTEEENYYIKNSETSTHWTAL